MPTPAEFYSTAHLGDLFGATAGRPTPHRGVDFNRWAAGTRIPSWSTGVVTGKGYSRNLGWYVQVRIPGGLYTTYCHLQGESPRFTGESVHIGEDMGPLGNTGLQSRGAHVHICLEPGSAFGTWRAIDPLPHIRASIGSIPAGDSGTQIRPRRRKSMATLYWTKDSEGPIWALAGDSPRTPANWRVTRSQGLANELAEPHGSAVYLKPDVFNAWRADYLAGSNPDRESVGSVVIDDATIQKLAEANAKALIVEQKKAGN